MAIRLGADPESDQCFLLPRGVELETWSCQRVKLESVLQPFENSELCSDVYQCWRTFSFAEDSARGFKTCWNMGGVHDLATVPAPERQCTTVAAIPA